VRRRGLASIDLDVPSPFGLLRPHRPYQSRCDLRIEHRQAGGPEARSRRIENRSGQSARLGLPQRRRASAPCQIASRTPRSSRISVGRAAEHSFERQLTNHEMWSQEARPTTPSGEWSGTCGPRRLRRHPSPSWLYKSWCSTSAVSLPRATQRRRIEPVQHLFQAVAAPSLGRRPVTSTWDRRRCISSSEQHGLGPT
jgi:hypothetical protein